MGGVGCSYENNKRDIFLFLQGDYEVERIILNSYAKAFSKIIELVDTKSIKYYVSAYKLFPNQRY